MYLWKTLMNFLANLIFCMHNLWMIYQRYPLLIHQNYLEGANLWHINFLQMIYDFRKMTLGRGSAENTGYWPWVRCSLEYFTLQSHLDQSSSGLESHYRYLFSHHFFSSEYQFWKSLTGAGGLPPPVSSQLMFLLDLYLAVFTFVDVPGILMPFEFGTPRLEWPLTEVERTKNEPCATRDRVLFL